MKNFSLGNQLVTERETGEIRLLVRADDMGCSHAANAACLKAYRNGIVRSVEVMAPGPWFEEAAGMLRNNPGVDVGAHLVLTSEWDGIKWRPLTSSPTIVDKDGYFCPFIWHNSKRPECAALCENAWQIDDIEREFRAQIKLVKKKVPQVSHITAHMGCDDLDPSVKALFLKLGNEYGLDVVPENESGILKRTPQLLPATTVEDYTAGFAAMLQGLTPGTYLFLDHPGFDDPEMRAFDKSGDVAVCRSMATNVLTSPKVIETIRTTGIRLIRYSDLANG